MGYYYNYYIGYKKDNKIYPLGPFNDKGKYLTTFYRSRSFASDLHSLFYCSKEEMTSDELKKKLSNENFEDTKVEYKYLPYGELPSSNYIRSGYFLIEDVEEYQKVNDSYNLFYDTISPIVYNSKFQNELAFGKNTPKKDCEGEEYTEPNASDFMYFVYPEYNSREYEVFLLKTMVDVLRPYGDTEDIIIIETEG